MCSCACLCEHGRLGASLELLPCLHAACPKMRAQNYPSVKLLHSVRVVDVDGILNAA